MHGTTRTHATPVLTERHDAAIWIEPGRALVVRDLASGGTDTLEVGIPPLEATLTPALAALRSRTGRSLPSPDQKVSCSRIVWNQNQVEAW